MCGIAGFWSKNNNIDLINTIKLMTNMIIHRGPDDEGIWIDENSNIALGHRRLSIIDLSQAGHQPMISNSDRYVIVFNGEIYNYREIKADLEKYSKVHGYNFCVKGSSDTEVMLAAIEAYGLEEAVKRFIGMFAFAVYDRKEKKLHLVRDRIGEKPLYYGWVNSNFIFASELKAICTYPGFKNEINRDALALYFRYNYIPAPYSIYNGIYKLLPGTILTISNLDSLLPEPRPYWSAESAAKDGLTNPFQGSTEEAVEHLEYLLKESIKLQMVADVPVGAFLSGGIDSSLVVSLMQSMSLRAVKTFTIGFSEAGYNEAEEAKKVAQHLGTEHTELYLGSRDVMSVIDDMPNIYDEPFSDSSQIPTFLVSKLARKHVTVSLSGDAGDELFGGYNRYFLTKRIWQKIGWLPASVRSSLTSAIKVASPDAWDKVYNALSVFLPFKFKARLFGDKIHKFADIASCGNPLNIYYGLISHWKNPSDLVLGSSEPETVHSKNFGFSNIEDLMMLIDLMTYLPDDILVKVDRAAMGVSLESRIPFLDYRVVEFAWKLPTTVKLKDGTGKWPLRQILYKYVPKQLIERPKMGFGVPIGDWIRGDLREWAETLLNEKRLLNEGLLNPDPIRQKWKEHLSGDYNWQYYLWDVLMFEAWLENKNKLT